MNRAQGVWATDGTAVEAAGALAREGAEVVEAVLSWRDARSDNVLGRKEFGAGAKVVIGEDADLLVPAEVLGYEQFDVATFDGDLALALVPPGAKLRVDGWARDEKQIVIAAGHTVESWSVRSS